MLTQQKIHIIGLNGKTQWENKRAKVKNFQSMNHGLLEYKHPRIDFSQYNKQTTFIVSSKEDSVSKQFVQKLKSLGFTKVKYLKDGAKNVQKLLTEFRGLKLFSLFSH